LTFLHLLNENTVNESLTASIDTKDITQYIPVFMIIIN